MHLDWRVYDKLVETTMNLHPSLWKRDADKIQQIEQAADIEAVLDLATDAIGLASYAWPKRIREFGPNAANHIVARLDSDWMRRHARDRTAIQEHYIGALRWCEDGAADALAHCWDSLDDYGRSLACIVLGLVGARQSADRLGILAGALQQGRPLGQIPLMDAIALRTVQSALGRALAR